MMNKKDEMHPEDRRNLILFALMAVAVWLAYEHFLIKPKMDQLRAAQKATQEFIASGVSDPTAVKIPRAQALAASPRLPFANESVAGSIALTGGRIDDLRLLKYAKTLHSAERVELLSPSDAEFPMYVEFGWLSSVAGLKLPDATASWQVANGIRELKPGQPATLFWENGQGLRFERIFSLDNQYMFEVTQRVTNTSAAPVSLYPYSLIAEQGLPAEFMGRRIQEGPLAYLDGKLTEIPYGKMRKETGKREINASNGWIGITEEYWFCGFIPPKSETTKYGFLYNAPPTPKGRDRYQVDAVGAQRTVAPGASVETTTRVFAGAKEVRTLEAYEKKHDIPHLDLAVDFGMLYFMTKPLFHALHFFYRTVGNMGVAIIMLTVMVRLFVFPLANISYRSFAQLRKVTPQMKEIRDKYKGDQQQLQAELVKLYEREKVNPMAGCLPMLVQIPIFLALYKVMVITIELRHAPFFGWIHDLSAPDPTTVFNLFGLIPWTPPAALMIGAWPCMMLATQLLTRNMNPPAQDKTQAFMINVMPFFFCYIMSGFASGLVVYWTFSGALAMLQQFVIMKSMGVEVYFFRKPKVEKELEKQVAEQPTVHPEIEVLEDSVEHALLGDDAGKTEPLSKPTKKKKK